MKVIIYPNDGGVAVVTPAPDYEDQIEAVASKDVPEGMPWRVIEDKELPPLELGSRWKWSKNGPIKVETIAPSINEESQ